MVKRLFLIILSVFALSSLAWAVVELDTDNNGALDLNRGGTNATTAAGARDAIGAKGNAAFATYSANRQAEISLKASTATVNTKLNKTAFDNFTSNYRLTKTEAAETYATKTELTGKADTSSLATVATSGVYGDLTGKPTLGTAATKDVGTTSGTVAAGDHGHTAGDIGAATAAQGATADKVSKVVYPCEVAANGSTDDSSAINACTDAANAAGGARVVLPQGKIIAVANTVMLKSFVTLDLNHSTLRWTGAAGGTMISNSTASWPQFKAGLENGYLDPRTNVVYLIDLDTVRNLVIKDIYYTSANTGMTALRMRATNRHPHTDRAFSTSFFDIKNFGDARIFERSYTQEYRAGNGIVLEGGDVSGVVGDVSIASAGSGYVQGEYVTVTGGSGDALVHISSVVAGVPNFITVYDHGASGYAVANNVATTGGSGTGLTVNITKSIAAKRITNGSITDTHFIVTGIGHNFVKYADNVFMRGQQNVSMAGATGTCAVMNSEGDGSAWNGVNNNTYDDLVCWPADTTAGKSGLILNKSEGTIVKHLTQDPDTYWSVGGNNLFKDNYSRSHNVTTISAGNTFGQRVYFKGEGINFSAPSIYPGYKTLVQADATATSDNVVTLPKTTGTLALMSDIPASSTNLTVRDEDGTPSGQPATLKFPNGSLTDNGDGSYSVSMAGGSVTSVSSANTDISVVNGSTTPSLTLNSSENGGAGKIVKLDSSGRAVLHMSDASPYLLIRNTSSTAARYPAVRIFNHNGTAAAGLYGNPSLQTYNLNGSWGNYTQTQAGRSLGLWQAYGRGSDANTAIENSKMGGAIGFTTEAVFTDADQPTNFTITLGKTGGNGSLTERFRVASDGVVSFGATSGGTATIQSTSHATKGLLTIANDTSVTGNLTAKSFTEGTNAASGTAITVSLTNGSIQRLNTTGNATVTLPTLTAGQSLTLNVCYGGVHTLAFTGATVKWPNGIVPTATSISGKCDKYVFDHDGTDMMGGDGGRNY